MSTKHAASDNDNSVHMGVLCNKATHLSYSLHVVHCNIATLGWGGGGNNTKKLFYKVRKRTDDWLLPTAMMTTQHRQRNRHELVGRPPHWRHRGMTGRGQVVMTAPPHGS